MKHYFLKAILLGTLGIFCLVSCQKTSTVSTPYTQMEGTWKLMQTATDDNNNGMLDRSELINVPSNDVELIKFNTTSAGEQDITINDTTTTYTFTWTLITNFTYLSRIEEGDTIISHIDDINNSDLTLKNNTTPVASWEIYRRW